MSYLYLGIAIVAEVIATTALKSTAGFTRPWPSLVVVLGYSAAFYFLSLCLRTMAVGVVYAIWSAVGILLVTLLAWLIYGQRLDLPAALGMLLIIAGVVVIQLFSATVAPQEAAAPVASDTPHNTRGVEAARHITPAHDPASAHDQQHNR